MPTVSNDKRANSDTVTIPGVTAPNATIAGMSTTSRITVPKHAHPLSKLTYTLMREQGVSYLELELRSGVLSSSFKAWRNCSTPSLASIEAVLGSLGWRLIPCPAVDSLPAELREKLEAIGQHFRSDDEALASAILAAVGKPIVIGTTDAPAPLLDYGRGQERGTRKYRRVEAAA